MVEYIIPIKGLSLGSHCYTYKIDDPFFANFENLDADKGLLNLVVDLMVESNLLNIRFYFTGYIEIINSVEKNDIDGNYSLKPTMFGLLIDKHACYRIIRDIVKKAVEFDNFVRIDMEDSQCVDLEIELFRKLKKEFPKNVGLVLQAYMRRTMDDINGMLDLNTTENPVNFRLCKGIYVEPENIAYKKYDEINNHFLKDLEHMFKKGIYPGIATHDEKLVNGAYKLIEKYNVQNDKFEFQMLYGVTPALRKSIQDKGYRMRIYVPFGKQWFAYSTRRLKENPKMAQEIIKALFVRG